jgi:Holliday junction resolvase RusA-like endonuclease
MKIQIEVLGDPAPQGSKRIIYGRIVEASSEKLKKWRKAIAEACLEARKSQDYFFTDAVRVEAIFYLPRPRTVKQEKRQYPIVPPDVDKLARGLLDGIGQSQMIWGDDSQVIELSVKKLYDDERPAGASVTISAL